MRFFGRIFEANYCCEFLNNLFYSYFNSVSFGSDYLLSSLDLDLQFDFFVDGKGK